MLGAYQRGFASYTLAAEKRRFGIVRRAPRVWGVVISLHPEEEAVVYVHADGSWSWGDSESPQQVQALVAEGKGPYGARLLVEGGRDLRQAHRRHFPARIRDPPDGVEDAAFPRTRQRGAMA